MSTAPADLEATGPPNSWKGPQAKSDCATDFLNFRREMGTISRQSAVYFGGTMFTMGVGYLFKIYIARKLGPASLGVYALGMTVVSLLGLVAAMGLPNTAARFVAAYSGTGQLARLRGFLGRSMLFLIGMGVLLGSSALLASHWIADRFYHTPALKTYMPMFALLVFTSVLCAFCGQALAGFRDLTRRTVITNFIGTPLMMVLAVGLITMGAGLRGYIAAQVISSFITLFLLLWAVWKLTPPGARRFTESLPRIEREAVHFSAAVFGIAVLEFLLGQSDNILLGFFLDARRVGIYAMATALVAFVAIFLSTVNQIFSPIISQLHARHEIALLGRLFQTLTKWILAFTIPLAAVLIVFAPSVMRVFGGDFEVGWPILVIGTLGQLVNCAVGSVGFLLMMSGNQRRLIKVQAAMAVATVLLNLALIPALGFIGAALVGGIVNIITNLWCLAEVRHALGISPYNRGYLALIMPSLAVASLLAAFRYTGHQDLNAFWIVAAVALSYLVFAGGMLLFGLDSNDRIVLGAVYSRVSGIFSRSPEVQHDGILA
ncbi:MAG: flippase [Candidatus Sulfotelmatobacter sp.]